MGMVDGTIKNSQLYSEQNPAPQNTVDDPQFSVYHARLNHASGWNAFGVQANGSPGTVPRIFVVRWFGWDQQIEKIDFQGCFVSNSWVTQFQYQTCGDGCNTCSAISGTQNTGNTNSNGVNTFTFSPTLTGVSCLKILPVTWSTTPCMRLEFHTKQYSAALLSAGGTPVIFFVSCCTHF